MKGKVALTCALALVALPSFGDDLWNQIVGLPSGFASFPDQEFDDGIFDAYRTYMANDVEVVGTGWNVNSVSVLVGAAQPSQITNITQAKLNVFANTSNASTPLSTDDPANGQVVTVGVTLVSSTLHTYLITATGLNVNLSPGEYWIDLTPVAAYTLANESLEVYSQNNGAGALRGTAVINPGGGYMFASGLGWDTLQAENHNQSPQYGAIDIQGTPVPEPLSGSVFLVGLAACCLRRRRR